MNATIIETSPLVIFPTSQLPLPKDEMKIALKLAWMTYEDTRLKNFVMQAYSYLADFRDDVRVRRRRNAKAHCTLQLLCSLYAGQSAMQVHLQQPVANMGEETGRQHTVIKTRRFHAAPRT